ncbi:MAG: hypothetical protein HYX69_04745 [Planctomycetia bacterium]|nr:hypothetical protein [Planctomycetia bacterium]
MLRNTRRGDQDARGAAPKQSRRASVLGQVASGDPGSADSDRPLPIRWLMPGIGCLLVVVPTMYFHAARQVANRDAFVYAEIAKEVVSGKRLYAEAWMDKPPLAILAYAAPQLVAPRSYGAIALFCGITIAVQAALFAWAFRQCTAAIVGCVTFIAFYPFTTLDFLWPSTEHFSNLFVTGCVLVALAITRRGRFSLWQCFGVGALACATFHIRQHTVVSGLVPAVAVLLAPRPAKEKLAACGAILAGAAVMAGAVLALVAWLGDLDGYFWTVFRYPFSYVAAGRISSTSLLLTFVSQGALPFLVVLFASVAAYGRFWPLVASALVAGAISCIAPMHGLGHYCVSTFPYITLFIGLALERIARIDLRLTWSLAAALAVGSTVGAATRMYTAYADPTYLTFLKVAEAIDRMAPPDATLSVCGPEGWEAIQFASRLPAPNTFCMMFQLQPPWVDMLPKPIDAIFADYLAHPPDAIIIEQGVLDAAQARDGSPGEVAYVRLMRSLLDEHRFRRLPTAEGYAVLVRQPHAGGNQEEQPR